MWNLSAFKFCLNKIYVFLFKTTGTIAGVKVPFPLPQADACANGVTCPVLNGTDLSETISLSILNVYPTVFCF